MLFILFVYWNICNNDLSREIVDLCYEFNIDILILGEHNNINENVIKSRFADLDLYYKFEYVDRESKAIIIRKSDFKCTIIRDGFCYSTYKIRELNSDDILLFAVHLPSQLHKDEYELTTLSTRIIKEFESIEKELEIDRSLIVGDFNMNPFSRGMTDVNAFNSIMCKKTALKLYRKVYGEKMGYFYNPMWHLMGNKDNEVLGTYFHHKRLTSYVWNTFDQVIIRPNLINIFIDNSLQIITRFAKHDLLTLKGRPNEKKDIQIIYR